LLPKVRSFDPSSHRFALTDVNVRIGLFVTKMFHPNVAASGEICVNTLKKDWKSEFGISHILLVMILKVFVFPTKPY
jgi:hypothetical protein